MKMKGYPSRQVCTCDRAARYVSATHGTAVQIRPGALSRKKNMNVTRETLRYITQNLELHSIDIGGGFMIYQAIQPGQALNINQDCYEELQAMRDDLDTEAS